jgi:hypothetical protein
MTIALFSVLFWPQCPDSSGFGGHQMLEGLPKNSG